MGERLLCTQEVIGSNPFTSTSFSDRQILGIHWFSRAHRHKWHVVSTERMCSKPLFDK